MGTANDRAREWDEELHLKGVRVEERIPHRLSSNPLLPTTQQLSTMNTPTSFFLDNLTITRTDNRVHLPGAISEGVYPNGPEVSVSTRISDQSLDSVAIDPSFGYSG